LRLTAASGALGHHGVYEKGIKVTDHEMKQLPIVKHEFHGDWN